MGVCWGHVGMESFGKKKKKLEKRGSVNPWSNENRKVCQVRMCIEKKKKSKNALDLRNPVSSGPRRKANGKLWTLCQDMKSFSYQRDLSTNHLPGKVRRRFVDRLWDYLQSAMPPDWSVHLP